MRKLNEEQIDQLFNFTKKHYVELYDVQVELVDHLANAIEQNWETNPNIAFEEALQVEFKKFGVFGFTDLVEQKQKELYIYYNKMLWREILKFISIPKIIITVILYFAIFYFLKEAGQQANLITSAFVLISFIIYIIDGFSLMTKIKKEQKKEGKSWLLQSVAVQVLSLPTITFGSFAFPIIRFLTEKKELSIFGMYFFSFFVLFQMIALYVFIKIIKPQLLLSIEGVKNKFQSI